MKRNVRIILAIVGGAIFVGLALFSLAAQQRAVVPVAFSEARIAGAELAEKIVARSEAARETLSAIATEEAKGNERAALTLVSKELAASRMARDEAIALSRELEQMARALSEIRPIRAQVLATEAVGAEVALVSRLLAYNEYLLELFQALEDQLRTGGKGEAERVQELLEKINGEVRAINDFNKRFNEALAEFDKMF